MAVTGQVKNLNYLKKEIEKMKKAPKAVLDRTENDIRVRGPSWIAQGVVERYNIGGGKGKGKKEILGGKIGKLKITGSFAKKTLQLEYSGRRLTPVHFGMKPTIKPTPGSTYTMKWKVLQDGRPMQSKVKKLTKKQRSALGKNFTGQGTRTSERSPWMLQTTGTSNVDKVPYIPFQRTKSTGNKMAHVARAVSLPQMVTKGKNGPFHPEIEKIFNENLEKRFNHHMERLMK